MHMTTRPDSALGTMYERYLELVRAGDVAGLVDQYTDDCVVINMLTPDRQPEYVRGREALAAFLERRTAEVPTVDVVNTQWAETDDTLMTVEEITTTDSASLELYDNWFLEDGKIALHFAGVVRYPDGTYADGTGFPDGQAPAKGEPPDTPLGRMYREHIGFIKAKNVDGILDQYAPDGLVIGVLTEGRKPRFVRGRDELRDFFNGNFMGLNSLTSKIDQWAETENALMIVESIELELKDGSNVSTSFNDNWVLRDGHIAVHFAGVIRYPDGSYA
jgi:ketosteroid isomerase-like protein